MRMDHHCPWTGNCVGLRNHKYFVCFCFWTIAACLHVFVASPLLNRHLSFNPASADSEWVMQFKILSPIFAPMVAGQVVIGVGLLLCLHMRFLKRNETSIECGELMFYNPYRLSPLEENTNQILGQRWFWPFSVEQRLDGLQYPVNELGS